MKLHRQNKKDFLSISLIFVMLLQLTLITISSTSAMLNDCPMGLEPDIYTDPYIRNKIILKTKKVNPQFDYHLYTMHLSVGESYTFYLKVFSKKGGEYIFKVSDQSQIELQIMEWDENSKFSVKKIWLGEWSSVSFQSFLV